MSSPVSDVFAAALALSEEDRGKLAELLVASLGENVDPGVSVENAWAAEIARRLEKHVSGEAKNMSMDDAITRHHRAARGNPNE